MKPLKLEDVAKTVIVVADYSEKRKAARRKKLSKSLADISRVLEAILESLLHRKVPTSEARELAVIINFAEEIADHYRDSDLSLSLFFSEHLPHIGKPLRDADFFIDGKKRVAKHYTYELVPGFDFKRATDKHIVAACEALKKAIGIAKGLSSNYS